MHVAFEPIHYSYHLGEWAGDAAVGALISGTLSFARPYSVGTELQFACHFGNVLLASKIKLTPQLIYHPTHFFFFLVRSHTYYGFILFCFNTLLGSRQELYSIWTKTWYFPKVKATKGDFMEWNYRPLKLFPRLQSLNWDFSCPGVGVPQVSLLLHKRRLLPLIWFLTESCPALQKVSSGLLSEG